MQRPRVLVVEDEDLARDRLARLVGEQPEFELAGVCRNGAEALVALNAGDIEIALLDIEMPGLSGMDVLARASVPGTQPPLVIFITAHPRFAVDAFAGEAVDYVLKPFDGSRLVKALRVAWVRLQARQAISITTRIRSMMDGAANAAVQVPRADDSAIPGRLVVREQGRLHILRDDQIDWIEAEGRHCILHCANAQHRIDGPLTSLGARLRENCFVQVSRSVLVNVDRIRELQEMFKGNLVAVMKGGAEVAISRRFRTRVLMRLGSCQT